MPAWNWLLAAWQGVNRGRLVRRWCAWRCWLGLLLGRRDRRFARPRQRLALRARLGAFWGGLPAGHWRKLLAARQSMNCRRLVLRQCAWRILNHARQSRLRLLLGWRHRLFARPRQRLAIRAGQCVAG